MTATATYGTTGNAYLDGVLSGVKWGVNSLTFSFPTTADLYGASYAGGENLNAFSAFSSQQANAVRTILKMYASYGNLSFTEVTETTTTHGELRYAESNAPNTAWAYYPSTSTVGGDAWFNNTSHYYDSPALGTYAWLTMMHETGHALGLKHPHEASGSFGAMPLDRDSLEYTVMSYRSYVGASTSTGYTNGSTSYPQTLMMYDIAAIQKLYGANYATNAGDTVYSWNPTTGTMSLNGVAQAAPAGNKVFMTIWDGGGNDTYSFASYTTGVKVDLAPGSWTTTSSTQLASLGGGHVAVGNIANALLYNGNTASLIDNAIGGSGNDTISGNQIDNKLTGGAGNDVLDGRDGTDIAVYSGLSTNYNWVKNSDNSWTITDLRGGAPDGVDTLRNIELLKFSDTTLQIGTAPTTTTSTDTTTTTPNLAPTASADFYTTGKNTKIAVTASKGVLANDTDPESQALKATLISGPGKGSFTFNADGSFSYTPSKNFQGTVSFKYTVSDGTNTSAIATVTIGVGSAASKKVKQMALSHSNGHADMTEDQAPGPAHNHKGIGFVWNADDIFHLVDRPGFSVDTISSHSMLDGLNSIVTALHDAASAWHFNAGHGADASDWSPSFMRFGDHLI